MEVVTREDTIKRFYAELDQCDDPAQYEKLVRCIEILERSEREDRKVLDDKELRMISMEIEDKKADLDAEVKKRTWKDRAVDWAKVLIPAGVSAFVGLFIFAKENNETDYVSNSVKNAFDQRKYK